MRSTIRSFGLMLGRGLALAAGVALLSAATPAARALGADHPPGPVSASHWPDGLADLVNSKQRIHGFFVNSSDVFFFVGDQIQFEDFIKRCAQLKGLASIKLIVHPGAGRAKNPWQKDEGKPCDWKLQGCPVAWQKGDANAKGYALEIHFWSGGKLKLDKAKLPKEIQMETAKSE